MGLAGRKIKQRIGTDPRNLTWADDASKFGSRYLQSLGWTSGTGLGASGEGRVSHLTVHQKLDLMGIGANRSGADEAAWKGGREYDGLLSRLNEIQTQDSEEDADQPQDDPIEELAEEDVEAKSSRKSKKESKKKRKRAVDDEDGDVDDKEAKRRRNEERKAHKEQERREKKEKKAAKKLRKEQTTSRAISSAMVVSSTSGEAEKTTDAKVKATATPIFRPHRARHLASKRLAAASAKSMNEILGISASTVEETSVTVQSSSWIPESAGTFIRDAGKKGDGEDGARLPAMGLGSTGSILGGGLGFNRTKKEQPPKEQGSDENGLFLKSGMNVADYFAEKLRQKQGKAAPVVAKADNNVEEQKKSKKVKV